MRISPFFLQFRQKCWRALILVPMILFAYGFNGSLLADEELPLLGEHAAFNLEQEIKIGEEFYQHLLARGMVETDPLLVRYINDLGARLVSALDHRVRDYRFFIVRDNSINAFALPGGYIGIHIGLILSAETQDQLASVMAHEIAHVRLRHGMKLMEKSSSVNSATLLTMLVGLLAGGGTDLGAALVYGGVAGGQQTMVNYTREFEYEADRLGIQLLQGAGFDGRGMVEFFEFLSKASGNSELQNIEYLRTHPVSSNRISEALARLKPYSKKQSGPSDFPLFKDYLFYVNSSSMALSGSVFRRALANIKLGREGVANEWLKGLYENNSDNFWYGYVYAENLELLKQADKAEEVYRQLLEIYPDDSIASIKLMHLLKNTDRFTDALAIARQLENRYPDDQAVFFELADIYRLLKKDLQAMIAQADYHRLSGSKDLAIKLYSKILKSPDIDLATESKVREKLAELNR